MEKKQDYDSVADLYADVFSDIRVRGVETDWLISRLPDGEFAMLEIGCGSGSLMKLLAPRISRGLGVDVSAEMIRVAGKQNAENTQLEFKRISGPVLPAPGGRLFDLAVSMLSWRYVDWSALPVEILKSLKPGGRLLLIDMTGKKAAPYEYPLILAHRLRAVAHAAAFPGFRKRLNRLVRSEGWNEMRTKNPVIHYNRYRTFVDKCFPGNRCRIIDRSLNSRIIAMDSGPLVPYLGEGTVIMDWGIGGFGLYSMLKKEFPDATLFYFSDSGFRPYGKCSSAVLVRRLQQIIDFFSLRGVKNIIVACNAMSTVLESGGFSLPAGMSLTGVIRPALDFLLKRKAGKIAVIGGRRTIKSGAYRKALSAVHQVCENIAQPLSAMIETGDRNSPLLEKTVIKIIAPLKDCSAMVLACTHYPAILPLLKKLLPDTEFIDPAAITFETVIRNWEIPGGTRPEAIFTSGNAVATEQSALLTFGVKTGSVQELGLDFTVRE